MEELTTTKEMNLGRKSDDGKSRDGQSDDGKSRDGQSEEGMALSVDNSGARPVKTIPKPTSYMLLGHIQEDEDEAILWLNEKDAIKAFQELYKDTLDAYQNISEYSDKVPFWIDIFSKQEVKLGRTYQYVYYREFAEYSQPFGNTGLWILFVPRKHGDYDIYNMDGEDHYTYYLFDERGLGVQGQESLGIEIGEFQELKPDTPEWTSPEWLFDGDQGTIQVTAYDGYNWESIVCTSVFSIQAIMDKTFPISDCAFWKNLWELYDQSDTIDKLYFNKV